MRVTCDFRVPHDEMLFVLYPNSCSAPEPCSGRHHCHLGELMVEQTKKQYSLCFQVLLRLLRLVLGLAALGDSDEIELRRHRRALRANHLRNAWQTISRRDSLTCRNDT